MLSTIIELLCCIIEFQIPHFTEINDYVCSTSYGKYGTQTEAHFACAADPNCKFVQRDQCVYPSVFGNFKLCGYDSTLIFSASSCVYKKPDADSSGSIFSNHMGSSKLKGNTTSKG